MGAFLVKGELRREGPIAVLEALDPVTGGPVLLFRPLSGRPPRIEVARVLPYQPPVEDAWVVELPFGVENAARLAVPVELDRLLAWTRRLLLAFGELEAAGRSHGRLGLEDLWVRGEAVWVSGVGVPWPDPEPDAPRLVAAIRRLAGDAWEGWPAAGVLGALAEGRLGYQEALAALNEPGAPPPEAPAEATPPERPKPPPSVRVKGRAESGGQVPPGPDRPPPPEPEPPAPVPPRVEEPPEVVRIEEPVEPAFEVVSPPAPPRRRALRTLGLGLLLLALLVAGGLYLGRRGPAYVQEVRFEVVPEGATAELHLLSAPEGSRLGEDLRVRIPGKLRFDRPGVYTFEVESPGYKPKTFALEVPVLGGTVTVRLGGR